MYTGDTLGCAVQLLFELHHVLKSETRHLADCAAALIYCVLKNHFSLGGSGCNLVPGLFAPNFSRRAQAGEWGGGGGQVLGTPLMNVPCQVFQKTEKCQGRWISGILSLLQFFIVSSDDETITLV